MAPILKLSSPPEETFEIDVKLAPHPFELGLMRPDPKRGKKARTAFAVLERFQNWTLVECRPATGRTRQIRAHLRWANLPLVGDARYGGRPLLLSEIKRNYRQKKGVEEKPLIGRSALHAQSLSFAHPATRATVNIRAEWPKDLTAAVKCLRLFGRATLPL